MDQSDWRNGVHLDRNAADMLREVGNIGAAHAATSLSEMLRQRVTMEVPRVEFIPFDDVTEILGGPEQVVACVYLRMQGEVTGSIFFIQTVSAAALIAISNKPPFHIFYVKER